MRIRKLNESVDIHSVIREAKERGLFNAKNVRPPDETTFKYDTLGQNTVRYNYYTSEEYEGSDILEVRTYLKNSDGEIVPTRHITIYRDGKWAKIDE